MKMKRLIKLNNMKACKFQAADGEIGTFADIFIDDSCFAIRFFSVNTKNWLPKRKVLLSPFSSFDFCADNRCLPAGQPANAPG